MKKFDKLKFDIKLPKMMSNLFFKVLDHPDNFNDDIEEKDKMNYMYFNIDNIVIDSKLASELKVNYKNIKKDLENAVIKVLKKYS